MNTPTFKQKNPVGRPKKMTMKKMFSTRLPLRTIDKIKRGSGYDNISRSIWLERIIDRVVADD